METPGLPEVLTLVLGGGLVATAQGIIHAITAYREGARARERDVLTDTEAWRRSSDDARRRVERELEWWRARAVRLWQQCVEHGGEPGPLGSPPNDLSQ